MDRVFRRFCATFSLLLITMVSISAADSSSSDLIKGQSIAKGVEVLGLESCEFKGLTSFLFAVNLRSTTNTEYSMEGGEVALLLGRDTVALLRQNSPAVLKPHTEGVVNVLWSIERIEPMSMMLLSAKMLQQNYEGMGISYRVIFNEGRRKREMVKQNLDLEKFMTIFGPVIMTELGK